MEIYLIRHGLAGDRGTYADDTQRPLTKEGREKTKQVAQQMRSIGLRFDRMLTSPYVRAQQTAEILMQAKLSPQLEEAEFLAHDGKLEDLIDWWQNWERSRSAAGTDSPDAKLALVGHEPDLSAWAEQLIWGEVRGKFVLKKAGAIGLNVPESGLAIGQCELFWLTAPRLLLSK
ncbi:MAG: phosphohistidine phosphatase SixA [Microcoleus sp. SIO2G3]|nr:phosphohistidine phosphatase SixA [Microcoleus sp. SIO2G3]